MNSAHHAPSAYNFGILDVMRLENDVDAEWRTVQTYFPHGASGYWSRMYNGPSNYQAENGWNGGISRHKMKSKALRNKKQIRRSISRVIR